MTSLIESELYREDEELAQRLWGQGFRPMYVHQLKKDNIAVIQHTMFGLGTGSVGYTTVFEVKDDGHGTCIVKGSHGSTVADDEQEVWAK